MRKLGTGLLVAWSLFGVAVIAGQGPGLHRVMREKLTRSQKILEAVVTSNWPGLDAETRALEALTNDPAWAVLKAPEYQRQSAAFRRAIQELRQAAANRDLEKTPAAYNAVTLRCVECHRYVARERVAK